MTIDLNELRSIDQQGMLQSKIRNQGHDRDRLALLKITKVRILRLGTR